MLLLSYRINRYRISQLGADLGPDKTSHADRVKRFCLHNGILDHFGYLLASCIFIVTNVAISCYGEEVAMTPEQAASPVDSEAASTFSPASYVRIFEDTGRKKILVYAPHNGTDGDQGPRMRNKRLDRNSSLITVDGRSTILIELATDLMDESVPMNRLFMSATLGRGDGKPPSPLEVVGYSEVGKAQEGAESQKGVSLQTGGNLQRTLLNMFFTIQDIVETLYGEDCADKLAQDPTDCCGKQKGTEFSDLVKSRFRLYVPEFTAISDFFLAPDTAQIAGLLGSEAFDVDPQSLQAIMTAYRDNLNTIFDQGADRKKQEEALEDLVERTKLFWHDFKYIEDEIDAEAYRLRNSIVEDAKEYVSGGVDCFDKHDFEDVKNHYEFKNPNRNSNGTTGSEDSLEVDESLKEYARQCYAKKWNREIADQLKQYFVPGQIFLSANNLKSGDTVMLRIEAKESAGVSIGIPAQFQFKIRDRRTRVSVSPSLLFVNRLDIGDADIFFSDMNAVKPVNFSPFPGVTLGATYHSRGLRKVSNESWVWAASDGGFRRFLSALAPGIGINVTFMNFGDPSGFDRVANMGEGAFTTTSGSNFEIGAGIVGSLFSNNIQLTYGFNLNVHRKRAYFGIGFGFVEVGRRLTNLISQ